MEEPLISVIVPVYQAEEYLRCCVDSLLDQTWKNIEILLIDDGSTDAGGRICDEYAAADARVRVLHQSNSGVSAARNRGLERARGEWIGFADSDDWLDRDLLACLLRNAQEHGAQLVQCGAVIEDGIGLKTEGAPEKQIVTDDLTGLLGGKDWRLFSNDVWGKLFRRDAVERVRFDCELRIGEDFAFLLHTLPFVKTAVLCSEVKYHYRQHSGSAYQGGHTTGSLLQAQKTLRKLEREYRHDTQLLRRIDTELICTDFMLCADAARIGKSRTDGALVRRMRKEIRRCLFSPLRKRFSARERLKLLLISFCWPLYALGIRAADAQKRRNNGRRSNEATTQA